MTPAQMVALTGPLQGHDPAVLAQRRTIRQRGDGAMVVVILAVDR